MDRRWSDEQLDAFRKEFQEHRRQEGDWRKQQQEMYDALFQKEDKDSNVPPGVVQLLVRTAESVEALRQAADRQKTFIGATLGAVTAIWFFVTHVVPLALDAIKKHT